MSNSQKLLKQANEVEDIIKKNIGEFEFVGKDVVETIQRRTRVGKGVSNGELKPLNPLSESYKIQRQKLKLDATAKPNRSNLTQTGQMLRDIVYSLTGTTFSFFFKSELSSNKAVWNADKGRVFFELSKSELNGLSRKVSAKIREILRKKFTN